ncbi:MAG: hypothetical protein FVQ80_11025 [Planctomycetes bacterium]|nr:hypothetical protein [Planctomycetota bacterium]
MATHTVPLTITDEEIAKMAPNLYHVRPKPEGVDDLTHMKTIVMALFETHYLMCVKSKAKFDANEAIDTDMIKAIKDRNMGV